MLTQEEQVIDVLEKIRPYIQRDGGDVEFESLQDGIVTVRMLGACTDCMAIGDTLELGVKALILDEVPGIVDVRLSSTSLF